MGGLSLIEKFLWRRFEALVEWFLRLEQILHLLFPARVRLIRKHLKGSLIKRPKKNNEVCSINFSFFESAAR